jgi:integral membrane protein (TIGR01906 family)
VLPLFFAANAVRVLLTDTYVRAAYPRLGREEILSESRRTELALLGLRAVDPVRGERVSILRAARLPDGSRAFRVEEVRHMRDVRSWLLRLHVLQVLVAGALVALAWRTRLVLARALRAGAVATGLVTVVALTAMAFEFDVVLLAFHKLLFAGESWHFADEDTLIRVYPEQFWNWTGIAMGLLVALQAAAAFAAGEAIARRSRNARA